MDHWCYGGGIRCNAMRPEGGKIYTELRDDYQKAPEEIDEVLPMTHSVAALILQ